MDVLSIYRQRKNKFEGQAIQISQKANLISILRITIFIIGLIVIIYFANARAFTPIVIIFFITAFIFGWLVKYYNKLIFARNHYSFLAQLNEDAIKRKEVSLKAFDTGEEFLHNLHYYSNDLDIFGQNSLFQLLNHTTTASGREKLANYLLQPFDPSEIPAYQQATQELAGDLDWIQEFYALGRHYQEEKNYNQTFFSWINAGNLIKSKTLNFLLSNLLSLIALASLVLWMFSDFSFTYVLLAVFINGLVIYTYNDKLKETTEKTDESAKALAAYELLIEKLERSSFNAEKLNTLRAQLVNKEIKASKSIKSLKNIIDLLASRSNMLYWFINVMLMLDLRLLRKAESWKVRNKNFIKQWFASVNEFEFINSLAAFAHAHPEYSFPAILSEANDYQLQAREMGHPLIKPQVRVNNDFEITTAENIILITGSNMAGKSTFLRTVGVNLVLAQIGAPVCAQKMSTMPFLVFTSMRTQDNLEENVSSFYAELQRIKQLLELIPTSNTPVFFMLDELLKGTNSRDRHKGAMALVKQLHDLNNTGMVSTHDLELAILEKKLDKVANYSFESHLEEGELKFDYKLHEGVTESFNASILMQKMGINIKNNAEEEN